MKKFLKLRRGQKGFTLIELLIVVAILGILAVIVVPNVANMLRVADVAAANTEAANVELAAVAFLAENNGVAPNPNDWSPVTSPSSLDDYLTGTVKGVYTLDPGGMITDATPGPPPDGWTDIHWDGALHQWVKGTEVAEPAP